MIEAEIVEDYKVVELKQAPIILYDAIEVKSKEVTARIQSLNIEELEATEDNLRVLKTTRTELSKEHKELEEQRKLIKDLIMKPYNDFEDAYKKKISDYFKRADVILKEKIDYVEDKTLQIKIDGIKNYFDECNTHEFIKFEDLELKIIKSKSDKSIKDEIDDYLAKVGNELNTIDTLENKDRVLAKYQMHKDLNRAISDTNLEVQREEQIKAQNAERERIAAERKQQAEEQQRQRELQSQQQGEAIEAEAMETVKQFISEPSQESEEKVYETTFTVRGTMKQLTKLKQYMKEIGVR